MKKNLLLYFLFVSTLYSIAQEYKLVWEDNFENPVLNETHHWTIEVNGNGGGNNEVQYYRRENITIEQHPDGDKCLVISAKKENFNNKLVTSGRLVTLQKVLAKYGKIEARIQLPSTANGLWPAFWLMGNDISSVGWPRCGEIDVLEMGNVNGISRGTQDRYFNGACHFGETHNYFAQDATSSYSLQDGFHLYTLIWDENAIKMYLDQDIYPNTAPYFEMSINGEKSPGKESYYFHKPFGILFNLAVGGNFTGITGNSNINQITALPSNGTPVKMYVDYVRIYQKGNPNDVFSGPALMADIEKPTAFTASFGVVKSNTVEILLKATDNSGTIFYEISYGATTLKISGTSNVQKRYLITGLTPETNYTFSIVAKDGKANLASANPQTVSVKTTVDTTVPLSAAPTPTIHSSKVISVYSDAYASIINAEGWNDWWASTLSTVSFGGNNTLKSISNCCFGANFTSSTIDLSAMTKLHVDIYPEASTSIKFGLVTDASLDVKKSISITNGEWNYIDITLSELKTLFPTADFTKVKQVGFWDISGIPFYVDNVYFYNGSSTDLNYVNMANDIQLFPNPISDILSIKSNIEIKEIEIRTITSQLVKRITLNSAEKTINTSEFEAGNYFMVLKFKNGGLATKKIVKL